MKIIRTTIALAALGLAGAASAQGMALQTSVMQETTVQENGKPVTRMVPAGKVTPGDTVFYILNYANSAATPAADVILVNPVPPTLEFVSAEGNALLSADGKTYAPLAKLKVSAGGTLRPAQPSDITHVRWNLPSVAAGAKGQVRFQARLK